MKHAPGPVRADRRQAADHATPTAAAGAQAADRARRVRRAPPRPRARSATPIRARSRARRAPTRGPRRKCRGGKRHATRTRSGPARPKPSTNGAQPRSVDSRRRTAPPNAAGRAPVFGQQDFDVYNRSSGAAWSMAARAYFRKGEAGPAAARLVPPPGHAGRHGRPCTRRGRGRGSPPRRGRSGRGGDGRRLRHARRPRPHAAPGPREGTTHIVRRALAGAVAQPRASASALPLIAWLPIAALVAVAFADIGNQLHGPARQRRVSLVLLLAIPRIAYVAALATVLVAGHRWPVRRWPPARRSASRRADRLTASMSVRLLVVGYLATAAVVVVGPASLRPWSAR